MPSKRFYLIASACLGTLMAGGAVAAVIAGRAVVEPPADPSPVPEVAIPVRLFEVTSGSRAASEVELTGVVRARHQTPMAFRVAGKVTQRLVEVGQTIAHGQTLFELDAKDYQLQRESAQANLSVAMAAAQRAIAEAKRLDELRRARSISESEYEQGIANRDMAEGQVDAARRQLELAENQLAYCRLVSDRSGVVTQVMAEAGQVVAVGTPVCELAETDELEAVVDLPENRLPRDRALDASARFWSMPGAPCQARLREIAPIADSQTRTYRARFTLVDPPPTVQMGMTVVLTWENPDAPREGAAIPASSLIAHRQQPAVWRLRSDGASLEAVEVEVLRYRDGWNEVLGLNAGDRIVSAGVQKLDETRTVRPWEVQR